MRKRYFKIILLVPFLIAISSFSQSKRGNIWYFGNQAGLDFNSGAFPPTPLINGQMNTLEGCATMSDQNGNLLFYTDGTRVWDRTHTPMSNANGTSYPADWDRMLSGESSSTQSAIVTPYIGNANRFYIFSTDGGSCTGVGPKGKWDGLSYTVVDMTLNGGLGDVDTAYIHALGYSGNKIPLIDSIGEKLTAAKHANGVDYWIITQRGYLSPHLFYAFHVSCSGIDTVPVISPPGYAMSTTSLYGYLTASFDGRKLASGMWTGSRGLVLYDFNNNNGVISNPVFLQNGGGKSSYGVAFSPNDSIIYAYDGDGMPSYLYRYQRYAANPAATEIADVLPGVWPPGVMSPYRALQVGPDGRIYIAGPGGTGGPISVLHTPNNFTNPGMALASVPLGGKSTWFGLPNFFNFYAFKNTPLSFAKSDTSVCPKTSLQIGQDSTWGWAFQWSPAAGLNNPNIPNPQAAPSITTTYTVAIILPCDTLYDTITVTITSAITTTITATANTCGNNDGAATVAVNGGAPGYTYSWSTTSVQTSATATGLGPGNYTVTITDSNKCTQTASVTITPVSGPSVSLTAQTNVLCNGGNTGSATVSAIGGASPYVYLWSPGGGNNPTAGNLGVGNYTVTITDANNCTQTQTVAISGPLASLAVQTDMTTSSCDSSTGTATAAPNGGTPAYTYNWSTVPVQTTSIATGLSKGTYTVIITDANNCTDISSVAVKDTCPCPNTLNIAIPNAFSPNSDGENDVFCLQGDVEHCIETLGITIYDRWGEKIYESANKNFCWDGIYQGKLQNTAVFVYYMKAILKNNTEIIKQGNISLIR